MIKKVYKFECEDCKLIKEHESKDAAQNIGWAIARGGIKCYCPACAIRHRNTGAGGAKNINIEKRNLFLTDAKSKDTISSNFNTSVKDSPSFSSNECSLIEKYRELNAPGKKLVEIVIDTHLATLAENKQKKNL